MTHHSIDAAWAVVARVRSIESKLSEEAFLHDPQWRMLPPAKQETVLTRLGALREYDGLDSPTTEDALRSARKAGVALTRFYQLLSRWREADRSPLSIVPYQSLGVERPSRLAAQKTADAIAAAMRTLLEVDPLAPTGRVIAHVRRNWKGPGDLPSDTALRIFHDRAIRDARPAPGTLTLSAPAGPQEADVVAERLAETLVIDHVSIKGLVAEEDGLQPTVTLAIDLWSGCALGAAAVAGPPGPDGLSEALRDVSRRLGGSGGRRSDAASDGPKPRLVIATTFAKRWAGMVEALLAEGYEVVERRDAFLQQGGPSRRLLGMRIGGLPLERRADRRERFDARTTAVQPLPVIRELLASAIDGVADERVPEQAWASAAAFDVGDLEGVRERGRGDEAPASGKRRRGRPAAEGPDRIRREIERMAAARAPAGGGGVEVHQDGEDVWHVAVGVADDSARDAAFITLAQGAMELSAAHRVPIVVDMVIGEREGEKGRRAKRPRGHGRDHGSR